LKQLANNAELRREFGQRGRATVESRYNLASNLDLLAGMWRRRLPGKG
jgi:hypothetical protein